MLTLGERWEFELTVGDGQGATVDLTGATVTMYLALWKNSAAMATAVATIADQSAQQGKATAVFLPTTTAALSFPGGSLYYQAWAAFDAQNKKLVAEGTLQVQKSL